MTTTNQRGEPVAIGEAVILISNDPLFDKPRRLSATGGAHKEPQAMTFLKSLPENAVLLNVFKLTRGRPASSSSTTRSCCAAPRRSPRRARTHRRLRLGAQRLPLLPGHAHRHRGSPGRRRRHRGRLDGRHRQGRRRRPPQADPALRWQADPPADGLTQADADAIFAAGWDDQALHDTVSMCALFNL